MNINQRQCNDSECDQCIQPYTKDTTIHHVIILKLYSSVSVFFVSFFLFLIPF